jgi:phage replication O-like protein O
MANPQRENGHIEALRKEFRIKYPPHSEARERIYKRDDYLCFYCKQKVITTSDFFNLIDKLQEEKLKEYQEGILDEDEYQNYDCRKDIEQSENYKRFMATLDHKIPLNEGGQNEDDNLVTCCKSCNSKKKDKIQLENGYTKIANALLEKLCKVKMSGQNWQVLIAIIRKLYGFNKKNDWIEYSQLTHLTNLPKSRICESVKALRNYGIITQKRNGIRQEIAINKDFLLKTNPLRKTVIVTENQKIRYGKPEQSVTENRTTKETIQKKLIQKKYIPTFSEFLQYAETLSIWNDGYKFQLEAKYNSWKENNWKDGNNKPIKNWKTKLQNVLPYFKSTNNSKSQNQSFFLRNN